MRTDTEHTTRPTTIHALHGVTPIGNWFVLAHVAQQQPDVELPCAVESRAFDASWLVILGRHDRDIITLQGPDA